MNAGCNELPDRDTDKRPCYSQAVPGGPRRRVVSLNPETVYLVYNCYYMRDICYNAYNFMQSPRGLNLHPTSGVPSSVFAYDFNSGKATNKNSGKRRSKSCPGSWKNSHKCPEANQRLPMRHDGIWYTTELEPGGSAGEIKARPGINGQASEKSLLRYTCEEFPAATWVEGGNGVGGADPAFTRCAGFRCGPNAKGEQNCTSPVLTCFLILNYIPTISSPF